MNGPCLCGDPECWKCFPGGDHEVEPLAVEATPGPWKVMRLNPSTLAIVAPWSDKVKPGTAWGFGDYRGIHVAELNHHSGDGAAPTQHAEANAAMLAASKSMHDAGTAFLAWFKEYSGRQCISELEILCPEYQAFVAALESAKVQS